MSSQKKKTSYTFQLSKSEVKNLPPSVLETHIRKTFPVIDVFLKEAIDLQQTSDPYVIFYCGDRHLSSSTMKKTNNPCWNEHFEFSVSLDSNKIPTDVFRLEVWGYQFLAKHIYLGASYVDLKNLPVNATSELTVSLEGANGQIILHMTPFNFGKQEETTNKQKASSNTVSSSSTVSSNTTTTTSQGGDTTKGDSKKRLLGKDRYPIMKALTQGGFGNIFISKDLKEDRDVILKKILCDDIEDANWKLQEFMGIRSLDHPNLVKYKDMFVDQTEDKFSLCYVLEFYKNGDLSKYCQKYKAKQKKMEPSKVISYCLQLLNALHYMHSKAKLMHRDLKPANILLSNDFKDVLICDFGMVRELSEKSMAHTVLGTPQYLAPEVSQQQPYGFPADVFSLAIIFYEMITFNFKMNFPYLRLMEEKDEYLSRVKKEITEIDPENYGNLADVVVSMMQLDPEKRITLTDAISSVETILKRVMEKTIT